MYPAALYRWIAEQAPARERAWDCAAGSGQAAAGLAAHFATVVATDAAPAQLAQAPAGLPRVVALAEAMPLARCSVDAVTVAQALHWLDLERFYAEVRRVLRPGGVLAAWCYGLARITPDVDAVVYELYEDCLGPFWPPQRRLVEAGYAGLPFPFSRLEVPPLVMETCWTLDDLTGYLGTWSAVQRYRQARGVDPVVRYLPRLRAAWGPARERTVQWPLAVLAGREDG